MQNSGGKWSMKTFMVATRWSLWALLLVLGISPIEAGAGVVSHESSKTLTTITLIDSRTGQKTIITGYFKSAAEFVETSRQPSTQREEGKIAIGSPQLPREPMTQ
jgi:hypothetical protein